MPDKLPALSGIATNDLVEKIGAGRHYINWSRTMELLRQHAPGWMIETVKNQHGGYLHEMPVGAVMMLRFVHVDGTVTPEVCQAVMDNRNNAIPYEKITARDFTDTHRRGSCLLAAFQFGLAQELWAKQKLEDPYRVATEQEIEAVKSSKPKVQIKKNAEESTAPASSNADETAKSKDKFIEIAVSMGLCQAAIDDLTQKINGNFGLGIKTLKSKDEKFVKETNLKFQASEY